MRCSCETASGTHSAGCAGISTSEQDTPAGLAPRLRVSSNATTGTSCALVASPGLSGLTAVGGSAGSSCHRPGSKQRPQRDAWPLMWVSAFPETPCPFDTTLSLKKVIRQVLPGGSGGRGSLQRLRAVLMAHFLPDSVKGDRKDGELFRYFAGLSVEVQFRFLADMWRAGLCRLEADEPGPASGGIRIANLKITATQVQSFVTGGGLEVPQSLVAALDKEFPVRSQVGNLESVASLPTKSGLMSSFRFLVLCVRIGGGLVHIRPLSHQLHFPCPCQRRPGWAALRSSVYANSPRVSAE